jgi:antitoxin Phd
MTVPPKKASHSPPIPVELSEALDKMVVRMRTPEAQAGLLAAFNATPEELGEAGMRYALKNQAEKKD